MTFLKSKKNYLAAFCTMFALVAMIMVGCQKDVATIDNIANSEKSDISSKNLEDVNYTYYISEPLSGNSDEEKIENLSKLIKSGEIENNELYSKSSCGSESYFAQSGFCIKVAFLNEPLGTKKCGGCGVGQCTYFYSYRARYYDCNGNWQGQGTYWCESMEVCSPCYKTSSSENLNADITKNIAQFISTGLDNYGEKLRDLYLKNQDQINHILSSSDSKYENVQSALYDFWDTNKESIISTFSGKEVTKINMEQINSAILFLTELSKVTENEELSNQIEDVKSKLLKVEGLDIKTALNSIESIK